MPYFSLVYVLDPSDDAITVLKTKFSNEPSIKILQESVGTSSIPDTSLDLAISLGVLHHIPDSALEIRKISSKIKKGDLLLLSVLQTRE